MDRSELVDALNEDLRSEYRSIVQYVSHVATVKGPEMMSVVAELRKHVPQEVGHALALAEQVEFLGGTPATTVPDCDPNADGEEALKQDLALETEQLERYRQRVGQAEELGLVDVAEALRPLLTETQEHVRDLQAALGI